MGRSTKDTRDIFYRLAKEEGWRARSAYKLLHMDSELKLLQNVSRAVDLCAAPGSWSQVLAQTMKPLENEGKRIVAVDIQTMAPIPGVECIKGDITFDETADLIIEKLGNSKADIVVCDGAPDVTGYHVFDEHLQSDLFMASLKIAAKVLETNGTFLAKIFRSSNEGVQFLTANAEVFFKDVMIAKPRSSRTKSVEAYIVGRQFKLPSICQIPNFNLSIAVPRKEINLTLRFGGGAENLVNCGKEVKITYPESKELSFALSGLLDYIKAHLIVDRPELFIKDGDVRPGILVLINDTDWELLEKLEYVVQDNDVISFISTLHGG